MTGERRWPADDIGVVAAGVAFVATAFLPWFEAALGADVVRYRGWDLGLLGVLPLLLSLYAATRVAWLKARPLRSEVPLSPAAEPFAAAFLAMALMAYRALDVPSVPLSSGTQRTLWLSLALLAVVTQAVFAGRAVARTGFRA